jgi:hypothetical protein
MKNTLMRASGTLLAALACGSMLSGCATGLSKLDLKSKPEAADSIGQDGSLYVHWTGLPARDGMPELPATLWTPDQFLDLKDMETMCHVQMDPQIPSAAQQIGTESLRIGIPVGIGGAIGTGLGAIAAFTGVPFVTYLKYGGLAALGSGLGSGAGAGKDRVEIAKHYAYYACKQWALSYAQKNSRDVGLGVIPWAGIGKPNGVKKPNTAPKPNIGAMEPDAAKKALENEPPVPPPVV